MSILGKAKSVISSVKEHWNTPSQGNYVPYKEIASLSAAGFGAHWVTVLTAAIGLSAGNFLVGACIGLRPLDLQIMLIVANAIGIPISFWRGYLFDNHHMKGGKFIPFLLHTALPIGIISTAFVWLPFEDWNYITKAVVVEVIYILLSVFTCFYTEGFAFLQQIISPNTQERASVMSVTQIIYSLAPSITNFIIPTIAGLTWGLNNIWTYRVIYPVFTVVGLILSCIFFRKVKERLVLPKHKIESVRISDAIREVAKNKYFWILNIAGWIGFLESSYGVILGWSFVYSQNGEKEALLGVANTVIGNAALWAMMLAPFAIKLLGKRNLLILCNVANILLLALLFPLYQNLLLVVLIFYINSFINVFANIYTPTMNADIRDYHQYKTGVRVDGLFGPLGLIGTVLGFFTGLIVPAIYERLGLHEDYNVLYNDEIRNNIFSVMIVCSVIGAVLNVIPYFFYDLTEDKHRGYIKVLKIRAMFEDYGYGDLSDDELIEAVEIINTARKYRDTGNQPTDNSALKEAKAMPKSTKEERQKRKEAISEQKKILKMQRQERIEILTTPIVIEELEKFSQQRYILQVERARKTVQNPPLTVYTDCKSEKREIKKSMPKSTREERLIRGDAINEIRVKKTASKLIKKYGAEGIRNPGTDEEDEINRREINGFADSIKQRRDMKALVKMRSIYQRATKPYSDANSLIIQSENYTHLDEIEGKYQEVMAQREKAATALN